MDSLPVKIRWVLKDPSDFFSNLNQEPHIRDSAMYLMILTFLSSALNYILTVSSGWDLGLFRKFFLLNLPLPGVGPVRFAMLGLVYTIYLIMLSFLAAGVLKAWFFIFGLRPTYTQVYQLLAYSMTPTYLLGWIDWRVSILTWLWAFVLMVLGSRAMFGISKKKAWLMFTLPALLVVLMLAIALAWVARTFVGA